MPTSAICYQPAYEFFEEDEAESITGLEETFLGMAKTVAEKNSHAHRAVHAKGQGFLRGRLHIADSLPPELSQGIFAAAGNYDTLIRFSSPPAEQLPDSVSTPRAIALKIIGVPGDRVPESIDEDTQDFLMVNAPAFLRPGPKGFLKDAKMLAATTEKAPHAKKVLSAVLRGAETVIEAVGGESAMVKNLGGAPLSHPLGETYFTQVPFMYGPYMAKFSLVPISAALATLKDRKLETDDDDAQRDAINTFFASHDGASAEWELRVQLCTDIDKMPIEDASVEWPQELSPYITVARLIVPPQKAWEPSQSPELEDQVAFDPWHAIAAHRPLGAINRARRVVLAASRQFRANFNRCPIHEPHG